MSRSAHPAGPRHADVLPEASPSAAPDDVNDLDPAIWPPRRPGSTGCCTSAARRSPTWRRSTAPRPAAGRGRLPPPRPRVCRRVRRRDVYYAGKAFLCTAVARWVAEEGLGLDVCTGGELAVAWPAGFPAERITFHGNNKSVAELGARSLLASGTIVVDSCEEIERLAALADARPGSRQRVLVRVTVGVEAHTHEYIATAQEDQKFGFSLRRRRGRSRRRGSAGRRLARAGRPALPHRLADLRHRRLRAGGPPGRRPARPRSATSTASSWPSSISAAASASPTRLRTTPSRRSRSPSG